MVKHEGMILWLTGLPAAGKSTIAKMLSERLKAVGANVRVLDGDDIRTMNYGRIGYSRVERNTNVEQVSKIAAMLKEHGVVTIVAVIAPYREVRQSVLKKIGAIEVFVDAPLEICIARDPKGLYARALRGEIKNFTGLDDSYEPPLVPDIHLHTDEEAPEESCNKILEYLSLRGLLDDQTEYLEKVYKAYPVELILSRFPVASLSLLKKFGITRKGVAAFIDDCLLFCRLRRYPYQRKILFVAGLPKSGTTWMLNLLSMVPGYHARTIWDLSRLARFHDISPLVFNLLPRYGYSVVKLHTRYTPDNFAVIKRHVGKFIVMYRDLRDVCVSRYHHVVNDLAHRHYRLYNSLSLQDGILHSINMVRLGYLNWVKHWHEVALVHPNTILEIRYEDLHAKVEHTMRRALSFLEVPYDESLLKAMAGTQLRNPRDLNKSLSRGDTKRKGIVGDWKNCFSQSHKDYFKEFAGDLLIQLGYESNENW